jgi:hypothetical protein
VLTSKVAQEVVALAIQGVLPRDPLGRDRAQVSEQRASIEPGKRSSNKEAAFSVWASSTAASAPRPQPAETPRPPASGSAWTSRER